VVAVPRVQGVHICIHASHADTKTTRRTSTGAEVFRMTGKQANTDSWWRSTQSSTSPMSSFLTDIGFSILRQFVSHTCGLIRESCVTRQDPPPPPTEQLSSVTICPTHYRSMITALALISV